MTPEQFIENNPFPSNGTEINTELVRAIQDPKQSSNIKKNVYKLLKNNARIIRLVHKQFNYNQSLASIMSFVYEGIRVTSKEYRLSSAKPYYSYLMTYVRGLLQKYYNYNETLIHVPVMKKKQVEVDIAAIDNVAESSCLEFNDGKEPMNDELNFLFKEYDREKLHPKLREEFNIVKMSRTMGIKEIAESTGLGIGKVRNIIKRTIPRLQNYYKRKLL